MRTHHDELARQGLGSPSKVIVVTASDASADLLVLGAGRGAGGLGSIASRVVGRMRSAVLVVPGDDAPRRAAKSWPYGGHPDASA